MKKVVAILTVSACFLIGLFLVPFFGCGNQVEYTPASDTGNLGSNIGLEGDHPYVDSVTPNGPLTFPVSGNYHEFIVRFNEEMDQSSTESAIGVYQVVADVADGANQLASTPITPMEIEERAHSWEPTGLEYRHYVMLPDDMQYVLKVASTATDLAGNSLDGLVGAGARLDDDFLRYPSDFESIAYPVGVPDACDGLACDVLPGSPRPSLDSPIGLQELGPITVVRSSLTTADGGYEDNIQPDSIFRLIFAGNRQVVASTLSGNIQLTKYNIVLGTAGAEVNLRYSLDQVPADWESDPGNFTTPGGPVTRVSSILINPSSLEKYDFEEDYPDYELTINGGDNAIADDWGSTFVDNNYDGDDETGVADDVLKIRFLVRQDPTLPCEVLSVSTYCRIDEGSNRLLRVTFDTRDLNDDLMDESTLTASNISLLQGGQPVPFEVDLSTEFITDRGESTVLWIIYNDDDYNPTQLILSHKIADEEGLHLDGNGDCLFQNDARDNVLRNDTPPGACP